MNGNSLIAGEWLAGEGEFLSAPATGTPRTYSTGTADLVDQACVAAEEAFWSYGYTTREERAAFLDRIADEIEARGTQITEIGSAETGLPAARLEGERGRTTGQLRLFADHIRKGDYLDLRHDPALPDRQPLPRPDLKMAQRPIGPVAVFGASNFPLAFSTAGGDTAAALAAGCPVVVKGHTAHPGTGEIVAEAVDAARQACNLHPGVFSFVQGGGRVVGTTLVQHPFIKAVGFTGSLGGGRALFDLCAARPEPIPFFGELGSVNPMFVLPDALAARGAEIGAGWAGSLMMGAGQFCTNPGLVLLPAGEGADAFIDAATDALNAAGEQTMLTDGIALAYHSGQSQIAATEGVTTKVAETAEGRQSRAAFHVVSAETFRANPNLAHEVFGPMGIAVLVNDPVDFVDLAKSFEGQLTATVQMDAGDAALATTLLPVLERKAGRVLFNGFPTGVEVADSMVHGGPYPASTNFGATSVGTLSIRRFLRPVCYQNLPEDVCLAF
ncbi:aldehyde dehydrogenase (NADP(+)) [Shimia sp. CNT1-13L.2]|uniref:aldehyde dehydrogenase (NADP(+)) n=1 Tax=Shimia sp. CNT1-13L.2 TaxID=2959663 RepID=UPI0020CFB984|nr:aldehyde dehydrogenase (NADP(+)) [Shimia sp. CNT1-13L.2]MCP9482526.1 aldehyde dehydrogenase (NADP(+)) [Shimia sp. CNT1-13L.2]